MKRFLTVLIGLAISLSASFDADAQEKFKLSKKEKKEGYKVLFDGTNMDQWMGNTKEYVLEDGTITMRPVQNEGGNLYTKEKFDNFVLRFEFLLGPAGNNGLGLRHDYVTTKQGYKGMELQILDNEHPDYKSLEPGQYHGSIYKIIPAKRGFLKPVGEWNYQEVVANGDHFQVFLNGEKILDGNLKEATDKMKAGSFMKEVLNKTGHIAFLGHGSVVQFKNIRVKELK